MHEGELNVAHVNGALININGSDMQELLVIDTQIFHGVGNCNDHGPCPNCWLLGADETASLNGGVQFFLRAERHSRHQRAN
ncbi:hypothetical protein D3C80_2093350 [compost metagenome]